MKVTIYTDGSARGNPEGPGGYGAVIEYVDTKFRILELQLQNLINTLDDKIQAIAREEDRLYSTDIKRDYIDTLFN